MASRHTDNPDYLSQFPDTDFGNILRSCHMVTLEFYREYVRQDHNHETISRISRVAAMALVQSSAYRTFLGSYHVDLEAAEDASITPRHIMNKGAIRITPTNATCQALRDLHRASDDIDEGHERWDQYRGWLKNWYSWDSSNMEMWVYNHDGKYYLTRPRKKPLIGMLNQKLNQILQGINSKGLGDTPNTARRAFLDLAADLHLTKEDEEEILKGSGCHPGFKFTHLKGDR